MRHAAVAIAMLCLGPTAAWALDLRSGVPEGDIEVDFNVLVSTPLDPATEFSFIDLVPFNDGTGRLAVSTVQGGVRVIEADGDLSSTHLLTKAQTELVLPQEAGLTGIAFHPDFNNVGTFGYGKFYTITTEADENDGGLGNADVDFPYLLGPQVEEHQDVVREWNLSAFGNVPGNAANNAFTGTLANSRELLRVDQPGPFHNVVDLAFNTNAQPTDADYGLLYITSGDGGNPLGMSTSQANTQRATALKTFQPFLETCCELIQTRQRTRSFAQAPIRVNRHTAFRTTTPTTATMRSRRRPRRHLPKSGLMDSAARGGSHSTARTVIFTWAMSAKTFGRKSMSSKKGSTTVGATWKALTMERFCPAMAPLFPA